MIVSVFLFKFLTIMGYVKAAKITFLAYITTVLLFDLFLIIDIFAGSQRITCANNVDW